MEEYNIKQIYSWILRRDLKAMKKCYEAKEAKRVNKVDLRKLYLNWNKLARGY